MKKFLFLLLTLFFTQILLAQVPKSLEDPAMEAYFSQKDKAPVLKGRLRNVGPIEAEALRVDYALVQPSSESHINLSVPINPDGSFEIKLPQRLPYQEIWLSMPFSFIHIILHEGLVIEGDLAKMRDIWTLKNKADVPTDFDEYEIVFSGPDADLNYMVNRYSDFEPEERSGLYNAQLIASRNRRKSFAERLEAVEDLNAKLEAHEARFLQKHPCKDAWILAHERKADIYGSLITSLWGEELAPDEAFRQVLAFQPALVSNNGILYYNYLAALLRSQLIQHPDGKIPGLQLSQRKYASCVNGRKA